MSIVSGVYLVGAIYLTCINKIQFDWKNLFNTDGLAILGCIFALGEIFLSNRNWISKKINQFFINNKHVNYRIDICSHNADSDIIIENVSKIFEEKIKDFLNASSVERRAKNKLSSANLNVDYKGLGISAEYRKNKGNFNMSFEGRGKYGNINNTKYDILYFSSIVKFISNIFLEDRYILENLKDIKIEIVVSYQGSQFKPKNLFNEGLPKVERYDVKIIKGLSKNIDITINTKEIKLSSLAKGELIDGFIELTNIICNIG
ncbi:Uncharacterised protein [[Clostridium] sordellii]|uniref:hypothetical protein n=1 Tax=Paraclostridium sordellii TaxID=1505 RepID=UPI0005E3DB62|nr:hypothetical protein [Paeniclostridium sordellii]CEN89052.1 Uncharacterised protein [[Clostridium] sordellii] [Paeniclostridium sordellii]